MKQRQRRIATGIAVVAATAPVGHVVLGPSIIPPALAAAGLVVALVAALYLLIARRQARSEDQS